MKKASESARAALLKGRADEEEVIVNAAALHNTFNAADQTTFKLDQDAEELIEMAKIVKVAGPIISVHYKFSVDGINLSGS